MKVIANPNKLPHLLDNQVGAVKDFLGIPRGEALPMTKPVLCILFIVGVVCNGTGTMRRFAATSKMDLATFAIMEPQEILEYFMVEMNGRPSDTGDQSRSQSMGDNWNGLMKDKTFETAIDKLEHQMEATKMEIAEVLERNNDEKLVDLKKAFIEVDMFMVEKIYACGPFTATALPPILVLAGFIDPKSRFAEFATVGLGSARMLKHLGLPATSLTAIADFLGTCENTCENFLCELWRHINEKSGRKFDFFGAGARDIVAQDGMLVHPDPTACHEGCVRFDGSRHSGRLVAAPSGGFRDTATVNKELAAVTEDAVKFMKTDMEERRQAAEKKGKNNTAKRKVLQTSAGPKPKTHAGKKAKGAPRKLLKDMD